jgi:lipid-A-disaccharide synthase-like uncharacterized protein
MELARIVGIAGLLCITYAIFIKKETKQDWFFVLGGVLLFYYSYTLGDAVFMMLQVVFTLASLYEIYTLKKKS